MRKLLVMISAMISSTIVMAHDSIRQSIDSLSDTVAPIVDTLGSLSDTVGLTSLELADNGITDSDFFFPVLFILAVNIAAFYSAKIPYLNKIVDTKTRTLTTGVVLAVVFSLSFPISILQLVLAYAVSSGIVYDLIMKKLLKVESVKVA